MGNRDHLTQAPQKSVSIFFSSRTLLILFDSGRETFVPFTPLSPPCSEALKILRLNSPRQKLLSRCCCCGAANSIHVGTVGTSTERPKSFGPFFGPFFLSSHYTCRNARATKKRVVLWDRSSVFFFTLDLGGILDQDFQRVSNSLMCVLSVLQFWCFT